VDVIQLLCKGKVDDAIACFTRCKLKQASNFCVYFEKHRHRIVNYQYYQAEKFILLTLVQLNLLLNRLTVELKFPAHNGILIMFFKFLLTVALILMD